MEVYYKIVVCRNNGEQPFYIKVVGSGEFAQKEFRNEEFNFSDDAYMEHGLNFMIGEECFLEMQRIDNPPTSIKAKVNDKLTFDINEIKVFHSCAECNKEGYSLTFENGEIIYPTNSDDFEGYENSTVLVDYNNSMRSAVVKTYKYHTKSHAGNVRLVQGCYEKPVCKDERTPDINAGRKVKPEILTRKISRC